MIPKGAIRIDKNDGLYCKTCGTYLYGDPERLKKNHRCRKVIFKRKFILFGKKIRKVVYLDVKPEFIPISEVKK